MDGSLEQYQGEDFASYIARTRERLADQKNCLVRERDAIDKELANIDREMKAIDAYEAAKSGKPARAQAPRQTRPRDGSRREQIIQALAGAMNGMTRGEMLVALDVKGDKSAEMSVSNALTALTKNNQVHREGGRYYIPGDTTALRAAAE